MGYRIIESYYNFCYLFLTPIPLKCDIRYKNRCLKLCDDGVIGIYFETLMSIDFFVLYKDIEKVKNYIPCYEFGAENDHDYINILHDTVMCLFNESEVNGSSNIDFLDRIKERKRHEATHFIIDNIDLFYKCFINASIEDEWIFELYFYALRMIKLSKKMKHSDIVDLIGC